MDESLSRSSSSFNIGGDEALNKSLSINEELGTRFLALPANDDQPTQLYPENADFVDGGAVGKFVLHSLTEDLLPAGKAVEQDERFKPKDEDGAVALVTQPPPPPVIAVPTQALELSLPPLKNWRLDGRALEDINSLKNEFGHIAYYKLRDDQVVVHLEDGLALGKTDMIMQRFHDIVSRCAHTADIDLVLASKPFEAILCSIGDTLFIDRAPQTIGMYVQSGGIVYWLSTAHGLLSDEQWEKVSFLCEYTDRMHRAQGGVSQVYFADGCEADDDVSGTRIRAPTPYACISYNPMHDKEDQMLTNYVDVMMGPVPMRASLADASGSSFLDGSLQEVRDSCQTCDVDGCNNPSHTPGRRLYAISEIYYLDKTCEDGYVYYSAENLVGLNVRCRPHQQNMVCGQVLSCEDGFFASHRASKNRITMHNVLVIAPTGRVRPRPGDSGSVWVLNGTEKAVAVTVGMGKMEDVTTSGQQKNRKVWLAALLHPCLDAFCTVHPDVFSDSMEIKPLNVRLVQDVTELSSNVSRLSTADSGISSYRHAAAAASMTSHWQGAARNDALAVNEVPRSLV